MTTPASAPSAPVALVTGASRGLGRALAVALADRGWRLIVDARRPGPLEEAGAELSSRTAVVALAGDVADPGHRRSLAAAVERSGRLDLLVNNASVLGPSPLVPLADHPAETLDDVLLVNTVAPLALLQAVIPILRRSRGRVINVSSDAAVEAYPGWGGYGASKAALDQLSAVLAVEEPELRIYAVDPGDMNTDLHQQAFPGEDISDRPPPESAVPALLRLVEGDLPSGRYQASALLAGLRAAGEPVPS